MLEIVMTVCAIANPAQCHEEKIKVFDDRISLLQCIMNAPAAFGSPEVQHKFAEERPGWRIAGYQCREYVPEKEI